MSSGVSPSNTSIRVRPFSLSTSNTAWWSEGENRRGHGGTETRWLAHFLNSAVIGGHRLQNAGGSHLSRRPTRDGTSQKRISASGGEQSTTSATPIDDKIAAITLATDPFKASLSGPFGRHEVPSDGCESTGASFFVCRFDVICTDTGIFSDLEFRRVLAIMLSCKTNKKGQTGAEGPEVDIKLHV